MEETLEEEFHFTDDSQGKIMDTWDETYEHEAEEVEEAAEYWDAYRENETAVLTQDEQDVAEEGKVIAQAQKDVQFAWQGTKEKLAGTFDQQSTPSPRNPTGVECKWRPGKGVCNTTE